VVGNALALSLGAALGIVVRRTNYSISDAFSAIFEMGNYQKLASVLVSMGIFSLVNIWGYEPCPT
jgi:hypothetical protein